jgi:hypothetical protein
VSGIELIVDGKKVEGFYHPVDVKIPKYVNINTYKNNDDKWAVMIWGDAIKYGGVELEPHQNLEAVADTKDAVIDLIKQIKKIDSVQVILSGEIHDNE